MLFNVWIVLCILCCWMFGLYCVVGCLDCYVLLDVWTVLRCWMFALFCVVECLGCFVLLNVFNNNSQFYAEYTLRFVM